MRRMGRIIWRNKSRLIAILVSAYAIYYVAALGSLVWLRSSLEREAAALEAQGIPTTPESYGEMLRAAEIGTGTDDATPVNAAIDFLNDLPPDAFQIPESISERILLAARAKTDIADALDHALTESSHLQALYRANAEIITELNSFTNLRPLRAQIFDATYIEGESRPHRPDLRSSARLSLCLFGRYLEEADAGDLTAAWRTIEVSAWLARLHYLIPISIAQQERKTMAAMILWRLQENALTREERFQLGEILSYQHPLEELARTSYSQTTFYYSKYSIFEIIPDLRMPSLSPRFSAALLLSGNDELASLKILPRLIDATDVSPDDAYLHVHRQWEEANQEYAALRYILEGRATMFGLYDIALRADIHSITALRAREQAVLLLAAIRAYEAERGGFPTSLESLVPNWIAALPRDPFTNADFAYEADTARARISWEVPARLTTGSQTPTPMSFEIPAL